MNYILAIMNDGEIEGDYIFESKHELTEKLSCLLAELVADGANFEDSLAGFELYKQITFDKEFRKIIRQEVDLEMPLVIKRQRDQAFEEVDRLMEIARSA